MKKYAKIINEETKEVSIFTGDDFVWASSIGFEEKDIEQAYNGDWYLEGYAPEKPAPTHEEVRLMRQQAFTLEADPLRYNYDEDCARYGYDSEQALASKEIWLAKKDEIRQRYPYPEGE